MSNYSYTVLQEKGSFQDEEGDAADQPQTSRMRPAYRLPDSHPALSKAGLVVISIVCLTLLAGLASTVYVWELARPEHPTPMPKGFFPDFGTISVKFINGGGFTRNDTYGDQLWDSLVPTGGGYVRLQNPRRYDILPSEVVKDNGPGYAEMYQSSVIHQLHCLGFLRNYTRGYEAGLPPPKTSHSHVTHCIEYLRQAVICTADTTLEQANDDGSFSAEGAVHQCRDWSLVKAFLEENRSGDETPGILET